MNIFAATMAQHQEEYGQFSNPNQQGFYQSGLTMDDQAQPGPYEHQPQQPWDTQAPTSYYSAPPPAQQQQYSTDAYSQQGKVCCSIHVNLYFPIHCLG